MATDPMLPVRLALVAEVAVVEAFLAAEAGAFQEAAVFPEAGAVAIMDRTYHPHKLQRFRRAGHKVVEAGSSTASQARYMMH